MTTKQTGHTSGMWRLYGELNVENHAGEYVCSCGQNGRIEVSKANAASEINTIHRPQGQYKMGTAYTRRTDGMAQFG